MTQPTRYEALLTVALVLGAGSANAQLAGGKNAVILRKTAPSSPTTQTYTSNQINNFLGAMFIVTGVDEDGMPASHARLSVGFCDATTDLNGRPNQINSHWRAEQAFMPTSDTKSNGWLDNVITIVDPSNPTRQGATADAEVTAVHSNGVTLTWTKAASDGQFLVTCVLFGGTGESRVDSIAAVPDGTTRSYSDPSAFPADCYIFAAFEGSYSDGLDAHWTSSFGFAAAAGAAIQQGSIANYFQNAADPTVSKGLVRSDSAFMSISQGGVEHAHFAVSGITSTGFTYVGTLEDPQVGQIGPDVAFLALRFDAPIRARVATHALTTTTGTKTYSGLGIEPQVVLAFSNLVGTEAQLIENETAGALGVSVFSSTKEYAHSISHETGINLAPDSSVSTEARSYTKPTALAVLDHLGSPAQLATFSGMTGSGFRLNFTEASTFGHMVVLGLERYPMGP